MGFCVCILERGCPGCVGEGEIEGDGYSVGVNMTLLLRDLLIPKYALKTPSPLDLLSTYIPPALFLYNASPFLAIDPKWPPWETAASSVKAGFMQTGQIAADNMSSSVNGSRPEPITGDDMSWLLRGKIHPE